MGGDAGAGVRRGDDQIAEIYLNRPRALNALDTVVLRSLGRHCAAMAADPDVRAVVLSARGSRAFCVGADLKERTAMTDAEILAQRPVFRAAFGALAAMPQPVIAAVAGFALGGGCELALNCDVIIADETAVLGLPETTVGLVPGCGGTQLLARRIGPGRAAEMILTGRKIDVAEAEAAGLIDERVPAGTARERALRTARRIGANSPVAVRAVKRALRMGADLPLAAAPDVEDAAWRTAAGSPDRREGTLAFTEKRRPSWPSARAASSQAREETSLPNGGEPHRAGGELPHRAAGEGSLDDV